MRGSRPRRRQPTFIGDDHRRFTRARGPFILHIGKTGGNTLRSLILRSDGFDRVAVPGAVPPVMLGHKLSRLRDWPRTHRRAAFAFVYRDPVQRYVSAFESRLRRGVDGRNPWSAAEALTFTTFASANDLFEGLDAVSPRVRGAAEFGLGAIGHVNRGHEWYLGPVDDWAERERFAYFYCPLDGLDGHFGRFFTLGRGHDALPDEFVPERRHVNPSPPVELSDGAVANLRAVFPDEFRLHRLLEDGYARRFAGAPDVGVHDPQQDE